MTFKTSFYGIPSDVRANTVIPLLVGPPGANASVADGSITNAKLANVATATFKGRTTAGTGVTQDLTATQATALLNLADGSLKGLMSASDFTKLAGVASGATANTGTVTTVSVATANGVSGSVTNAGTTPAITITLGAITPSSVALSGNISSAAWTTNGIRLRAVAATLTDTTSSGTVAAATTDVLGGNTIAASSATTFTDYSTLTLNLPTAGANVTMTSRWALRLGGGLLSSGQSLTGSQAQSLVDLSTTWNTSGTPTGLKLNVTDTASNADSLLMDLQVAGSSRFSVRKNGNLTTSGQITYSGNSLAITNAGAFHWLFGSGAIVSGALYLGDINTSNTDTVLLRDAANTPALRNGTNAQALRVYNTFTDASNYERGVFDWSTVANRLTIGPVAAGTGTLRSIGFTSHVLWNADNTHDIGASGATRPRSIYTGGSIFCGGNVNILARVTLQAPSAGVLTLFNNSETDFTRLQFGGATNSFGAIARDGAGISFVGGAGGSTAHIKVPGVTVASLPAAATAGAGARSFVTDALAPAFGSAVTGGGAVKVPVYSTGSAWNVG